MPKFDAEQIDKIRRGELKTAEVLDVDADQIAAVLLVGHVFYAEGKIEEARRIFEGLFVLDDRNPYVNAILGSIYQKLELYRSAVAHYSRAIAFFPKDVESLTNRGEIFLQVGLLKEAAADFKAAVDLDAEQKNPAANRARLLAGFTQQSLQLARDKGFSAASKIREEVRTSLK